MRIVGALLALASLAGCGDQVINDGPPPVNMSPPSGDELRKATTPDGRPINPPTGTTAGGTAARGSTAGGTGGAGTGP